MEHIHMFILCAYTCVYMFIYIYVIHNAYIYIVILKQIDTKWTFEKLPTKIDNSIFYLLQDDYIHIYTVVFMSPKQV